MLSQKCSLKVLKIKALGSLLGEKQSKRMIITETQNMTVSDDLNLSATERLALEELRRRVSNDLGQKLYDETFLLYRFLKARSFNVDDAEAMLRKNLDWKKHNTADPNQYKLLDVLDNYFKNYTLGIDKEGCPVFYIPVGKLDVKGLFMCAKMSELEKVFIKMMEDGEKLLEKQCKKLSKRLRGLVFIYDAEGLSFANASDKRAMEICIKLLNILQDNYPERLKSIIILNASNIFTIPFSLLKNFFAASILQKISIYGTDGWKEVLQELIDMDQLPAFLGGSKKDPDGNPLCLKSVLHAGKVDEKFYVHKSKNSLSNHPEAKKLVIPRASFSEIPLEVKEGGSYIEWAFETKMKDVGFGLFFKEKVNGEEQIKELVPWQRLDTENFAETGIYKCENAGNYVMLFDNSYSWIRSKEIYYRAKVVSPKELS